MAMVFFEQPGFCREMVNAFLGMQDPDNPLSEMCVYREIKRWDSKRSFLDSVDEAIEEEACRFCG